MDPNLRWDDDFENTAGLKPENLIIHHRSNVIPAQAGIQRRSSHSSKLVISTQAAHLQLMKQGILQYAA
ncbi:hypothetical protein [Undibacterium sp. Tian12W]|uniref:hypothetical protein n=1 Tax=Undibacterium sp. Tian12W TaxID=3413054 RepID=UPI003BF1B652